MPRLNLKPEHLAILRQILHQYLPEAEIWAYGSRINGAGHDTSDLDLVARNRTDLSLPLPGFFDIKEALSQSNLPILVDIIDWALIPETFHREIEKRYIVLWPENDPDRAI